LCSARPNPAAQTGRLKRKEKFTLTETDRRLDQVLVSKTGSRRQHSGQESGQQKVVVPGGRQKRAYRAERSGKFRQPSLKKKGGEARIRGCGPEVSTDSSSQSPKKKQPEGKKKKRNGLSTTANLENSRTCLSSKGLTKTPRLSLDPRENGRDFGWGGGTFHTKRLGNVA